MRVLQTKELTVKTTTYRAVQVSKPGRMDVVEREVTAPPPGKVRIRVEARGVCHSDAATVDGIFPGVTYPRVPGHEAVGRIDALGDGVQGWVVGQRVGVGFLGGSLRPLRVLPRPRPRELPEPGVHRDSSRRRVRRSDDRQGERARGHPQRPVVRGCGAAVMRRNHDVQALRNSPAKPGDRGRRAWDRRPRPPGRRVRPAHGVRGRRHRPRCRQGGAREELGAYHYIDSATHHPAGALQALGGAKVILITAAGGQMTAVTFKGLRSGGASIASASGRMNLVHLVARRRFIGGPSPPRRRPKPRSAPRRTSSSRRRARPGTSRR